MKMVTVSWTDDQVGGLFSEQSYRTHGPTETLPKWEGIGERMSATGPLAGAARRGWGSFPAVRGADPSAVGPVPGGGASLAAPPRVRAETPPARGRPAGGRRKNRPPPHPGTGRNDVRLRPSM